MSQIQCISLNAFLQYFRETYAGVTHFFFIFMSYRYIFDIEVVGVCDAINNKVVKWGFRYLGNVERKK